MLLILSVTAAAIWISGAILMVKHVRSAPVGFEDENGFHSLESVEESIVEVRGAVVAR